MDLPRKQRYAVLERSGLSNEAGGKEIGCHWHDPSCDLAGFSLSEVDIQEYFPLKGTHLTESIHGWLAVWIQPIDATHSLNISAGVLYPKVFLGRSFNFLAIAFNSSCE